MSRLISLLVTVFICKCRHSWQLNVLRFLHWWPWLFLPACSFCPSTGWFFVALWYTCLSALHCFFFFTFSSFYNLDHCFFCNLHGCVLVCYFYGWHLSSDCQAPTFSSQRSWSVLPSGSAPVWDSRDLKWWYQALASVYSSVCGDSFSDILWLASVDLEGSPANLILQVSPPLPSELI